MKVSLENEIEHLNNEIRQTKELLKLFSNGEDYYKLKIKKMKSDTTRECIDNLNEIDLKRKLDELSNKVLNLKQSKAMITIYNDGSEEKINLNDIQLFLMSCLNVNVNADFGTIKNVDKLNQVCVFIIEDSRLGKLVLDNLEAEFDHHIHFKSGESWIQDLLKVRLNKSLIGLNQINTNKLDDNRLSTIKPIQQIDHQIDNKKSLNDHKKNQTNNQRFNESENLNSPGSSHMNQLDNSISLVGKKPIKSITRKDLLLSTRQLIKEDYPLPLENCLIKKTTKLDYKPVNENSAMYAIDCEMCKTEDNDLDVTRISMVDEQLNVLIDELVKPDKKIIDYLTRYSGIKAEDLVNVKTTLNDIQKRLNELLPEDAILIGHSLNCDLQSLQLSHPYVIDTSCIYNLSFYYNNKPSLKQLASQFLKKEIQNDENGHCSIEDARAAMELVQLKLNKDITFGDNRLDKQLNNQQSKQTITLAEFLKLKGQNDVKIVYDFLELNAFNRFISITSKHLNKILDKIHWSLTLKDSICIVIINGRCMFRIV